jgi:hypothetical protein
MNRWIILFSILIYSFAINAQKLSEKEKVERVKYLNQFRDEKSEPFEIEKPQIEIEKPQIEIEKPQIEIEKQEVVDNSDSQLSDNEREDRESQDIAQKLFDRLQQMKIINGKEKGIDKIDSEDTKELLKLIQDQNQQIKEQFEYLSDEDKKNVLDMLNKKIVRDVQISGTGKSGTKKIVDTPNESTTSATMYQLLSTFRLMTEEELETLLYKKMEKHPLEKLTLKFPKIITFISRMLRDRLAIPRLVQVAENKLRLTIFVLINLVLVLFSYYLKKAVYLENKFLHSLRTSVMRFSLLLLIRVGLFVLFFSFNVRPAYEIFQGL